MGKMNRREFLKMAGRWLGLGLLVAGGIELAGKGTGGSDHSCGRDFICRGCGRLDDCVLPQAMSARKVGVR